jgi:hypothetical protein
VLPSGKIDKIGVRLVIYGQHDHLILHHGTCMYGVITREFIEFTGVYKKKMLKENTRKEIYY